MDSLVTSMDNFRKKLRQLMWYQNFDTPLKEGSGYPTLALEEIHIVLMHELNDHEIQSHIGMQNLEDFDSIL